MKFFRSNINKKIIMSIVVCLLLFNFIAPTVSYGGWGDMIGEKAVQVVFSIFTALPNACFYLLQNIFINSEPIEFVVANENLQESHPIRFWALSLTLGGLGWNIDDSLVRNENAEYEESKIVLPNINFTPYEIFSNRIAMFDVNFFSNEDNQTEETHGVKEDIIISAGEIREKLTKGFLYYDTNTSSSREQDISIDFEDVYDNELMSISDFEKNEGSQLIADQWTQIIKNCKEVEKEFEQLQNKSITGEEITLELAIVNKESTRIKIKSDELWDTIFHQLIVPQTNNSELYLMFTDLNVSISELVECYSDGAGNVNVLNMITDLADIQGAIEGENTLEDKIYLYEIFQVSYVTVLVEEEKKESSADILTPIVSKWYYTLRTVALVALLSVLMYVGIRIMISSTASEKSKYKNMLVDWFVGLCLLFTLHIIMSLIMNVNEIIIDAFQNPDSEGMAINIPEGVEITDEMLETDNLVMDEGENIYYWKLNSIEMIKYQLDNVKNFSVSSISLLIMYIALAVETLVFTYQYLRRVIYMAFLTMIAPLIAFMYPLDKINDGKAQGFNTWLREYIFNALIQPMHLLLYIIFIDSAMSLVYKNPLYAIVVFAFMLTAEKFIRKLLGFDKASTVSPIAGAAGAALLMNGLNKAMHAPKGGGKDSGDDTSIKTKGDPDDGLSVDPDEDGNWLSDGMDTGDNDEVNMTDSEETTAQGESETMQSPVDPYSEMSDDDIRSRIDTNQGYLNDYAWVSENPDQAAEIEKETDDYSDELRSRIRMTNQSSSTPTPSDMSRTASSGRSNFSTGGSGSSAGRSTFSTGGSGSSSVGSTSITRNTASRSTRGAVLSSVAKGILDRNLTHGKGVVGAAKTVGKGAIGLVGGATGLVTGIGAGIVTGDASKVVQYGAAGAAGGRYLGRTGGSKLFHSFDNVAADVKRARMETDIDYISKQNAREFQRRYDDKVDRYYDKNQKEAFYEQLKEIEKYGIKDFEKALAVYELAKQKGGTSEAIRRSAVEVNAAGSWEAMSSAKNYEDKLKSLTKSKAEGGKGLSEAAARGKINAVLNAQSMIKKFR